MKKNIIFFSLFFNISFPKKEFEPKISVTFLFLNMLIDIIYK